MLYHTQPETQTNLVTFPTCASIFHRSFRLSRYSIAARSLAVTIPSLSDAFAFHIRTFPSSDPVSTNRASAENIEDVTLSYQITSATGKKNAPKKVNEPLHAISMIHFWRMALPLLPYSNCTIPTPAHEFETGRTPVAAHHGCNMGFVYLAGGGEVPDIKSVEIMIF
jgi:hypothetical protein